MPEVSAPEEAKMAAVVSMLVPLVVKVVRVKAIYNHKLAVYPVQRVQVVTVVVPEVAVVLGVSRVFGVELVKLVRAQ